MTLIIFLSHRYTQQIYHPGGMQMHGGQGHIMPAAMSRGQAQGHLHGQGQPPHDMFGTVPRGPPMYMTGGDSRQHMSSVPLPPAPPVQSFTVQQQQQPQPSHPQGQPGMMHPGLGMQGPYSQGLPQGGTGQGQQQPHTGRVS